MMEFNFKIQVTMEVVKFTLDLEQVTNVKSF